MYEDNVRRIKDVLDIVDLISEKVALKKVGGNYRGLCPFHGEKTPSFYVSPERQRYHCFGCGTGGDVFTFVMETESLSFKEALEVLASRAGIVLEHSGKGKKRKNLRELMEDVRGFYEKNLQGSQGKVAREYLHKRKVPPETWGTYGLGWASQSWNSLGDFLRKEGFSFKEGMDGGLLAPGDRGTYDRFRGRLMFPITDVAGRTIAFGGRLVLGEGAKYINSPEGPLYSKRHNLYLLSQAKKALRDRGEMILVEGYMDALRLHLEGFQEGVASLGTALSDEQAELIRRFAGRVWVCYDADAAGQEAALRGMYILQSRGLDVRVVLLPQGEDPDSLFGGSGGKERFLELQKQALPLVSYHLRLREKILQDPVSRASGAEEIFEGLRGLSPFEVAPYISEIAGALGVFPHEVSHMLEEYRQKEKSREKNLQSKKEYSPTSGVYINREIEEKKSSRGVEAVHVLEAGLLYLLSIRQHPPSVQLRDILPLFSEESLRSLGVALFQEGDLGVLESRWLQMEDPFPLAVLEKGAAFCTQIAEEDQPWEKITVSLKGRKVRREYARIKEKIARNEASSEELECFLKLGRELKRGGH